MAISARQIETFRNIRRIPLSFIRLFLTGLFFTGPGVASKLPTASGARKFRSCGENRTLPVKASCTSRSVCDQGAGLGTARSSNLPDVRAYSIAVRSLEKGPIRATFTIDMRVQWSFSMKDWPALAWASV